MTEIGAGLRLASGLSDFQRLGTFDKAPGIRRKALTTNRAFSVVVQEGRQTRISRPSRGAVEMGRQSLIW